MKANGYRYRVPFLRGRHELASEHLLRVHRITSLEETGVAPQAIATCSAADANFDVRASADRAVSWLGTTTVEGRVVEAAPIGLYFARLCYDEALYPVVLALAGVNSYRRAFRFAADSQQIGQATKNRLGCRGQAPLAQIIRHPATTERRILRVAARLFRAQGFTATTVREIANAARLLPGSLHYRFSSKELLLIGLSFGRSWALGDRRHPPFASTAGRAGISPGASPSAIDKEEAYDLQCEDGRGHGPDPRRSCLKIELENPFPFTEAGNVPIDPLGEAGGGRFVSGDPNGDRLRVRYFLRLSDHTVVGDVHFGAGAEGPPGHAHGGSIAAVLDEAMGVAAWYSGHRSVAAQLTTNFRRMLPLGTTAFFETQLGKVAGRKLPVTSRLVDPRGELFADASALFVALSPERLDGLAPGRLRRRDPHRP